MSAMTHTERGWRGLARYAYAERPYDDVWPWLAEHIWSIGEALPDGGRSISLRVRPAGADVSRPLRLSVGGVICGDGHAGLAIRGVDAVHPHLFPELEGALEVAALPNNNVPFTQIGVVVRYRPPLGGLGAIGDRLLGREVADAALTGFIDELAQAAERELDPTGPLLAPAATSAAQPAGPAGVRRVFLTIDGLGVRPGGAVGAHHALAGVPGVVGVSVEPWTGLTTVDYDASACTVNRLLAAIE